MAPTDIRIIVPTAERPVSQQTADWIARSTASGVQRAINFNTESEVTSAILQSGGGPPANVTWDQQRQKSGGGCLRIEIKNTESTAHGDCRFYLFPDQHSLAAGEEVYVQYRQFVPAYLISHVYAGSEYGGGVGQGFKSSIISNWDNSNTTSEHVIQNTAQRGYIQGYHQDGVASAVHWDESVSTPCNGSDFKHQPSIDRSGTTPVTCPDARAKYGGLYSYQANLGGGYGDPDPLTGAFVYPKGRWFTIVQRIKINPLGQTHQSNANEWQVLAAADGDTQYTELVNKNTKLGSRPINTLWLLNYNSSGSADPSRLDTFTLYDEVIISTQLPAVPDDTGTPTTGTLGTIMSGLSVGQGADPNTPGVAGVWGTGFGNIGEYASRGWYVNDEVHLEGGGHAGTQDAQHHQRWRESVSAWDTLDASIGSLTAHQYDFFGFDPYTQTFSADELKDFGSGNTSVATGTLAGVWNPSGITLNTEFYNSAGSFQYWPDLNGGKGGWWHAQAWSNPGGNNWSVRISDENGANWQYLVDGVFGSGQGLHGNSCYLHAHNAILLTTEGGGYAVIDYDGTVSTPSVSGITGAVGSHGGQHIGTVLSDPVSGRIFVASGSRGQIHELTDFGASTHTWTLVETLPTTSQGLVAIMGPGYIYTLQSPYGSGYTPDEWLYRFR